MNPSKKLFLCLFAAAVCCAAPLRLAGQMPGTDSPPDPAMPPAVPIPDLTTLGFGAEPKRAEVVVVDLKGPVTEAQFIVLRRAIKEAERQGSKALIIDMDTPGGALDATKRISEALGKTSLRTITYVNTTAVSAGALIAVSCDEIYMAPVSAIGAAAVVMATGENVPSTMQDKATSLYSAYFRSVAERKGHNPDIATAFMDKTKEVKVGGVIINPEGKLLSLSAQEAARVIDGKPVLAAGIAADVQEVAKKAGFTGPIAAYQPTGFENISLWLTAIGPLLLAIGMIAGYIEFKTPGFGIPGIVAAVCFTLFFTSHHLAGLAGMELLVVFFLGFALVLVEVLFFPGAVLPALAGVVLMIASLIFAMVDHYPSQSFFPPASALLPAAGTLSLTALAAAFALLFLGKLFPSTPGVRKLVLQKTVTGTGASAVSTASGVTLAPGDTGIALSPLMPGGKGQFRGITADVVTEGAPLPKGAKIRILRVSGPSVVVEEIPDAAV